MATEWPGQQAGESLEDREAFYALLDAAPLEALLPLAREAAAHPAFDEVVAFEIGARVADALLRAGRFPELEGVLDTWRRLAPEVHEASAEVLAWRTELALLRPGSPVGSALDALARVDPLGGAVQRLAEWCLYRGLVKPALAGLCEAWPHVLACDVLSLPLKEAFSARLVLTGLDVAQAHVAGGAEAALREALTSFGGRGLDPRWFEGLMRVRTGLTPWRASPDSLARLSLGELARVLRVGVMALEVELRTEHGWPLGRTQLLHPGLLARVLDSPGVRAGLWTEPEELAVLLPDLGLLERWAGTPSEERFAHPHAHAAVALALRPWGAWLLRLGWIRPEALAGWWSQVPRALAALPASLAEATSDAALALEVQRGLLSPPPPP